MPYLLHRPDGTEPSKLTESDARRIIDGDFPDPAMRTKVWEKLVKGEKVYVHRGQLEWVSWATETI